MPIDAEDLKACKAVLRDPIDVSWNGAQVALASGLTAGPTFRRVLENLPAGGVAKGPGAEAFLAYADALRRAHRIACRAAERQSARNFPDDSIVSKQSLNCCAALGVNLVFSF